MKTDSQLKADVIAELMWEPEVNESQIGVSVEHGIVTLTGHPATYSEKVAAQRAAQRVGGVKALAIEMHVKLEPAYTRTDSAIASAVEHALEWNALVPDGKITPSVENGWVTLKGEVAWDYQRRAAERSTRDLVGVRGVSNLVAVKPLVKPSDIRSSIQRALHRQVDREAKALEIKVNGSVVTLEGTVHSWDERVAVQGAAWSAPGVSSVVNDLVVAP